MMVMIMMKAVRPMGGEQRAFSSQSGLLPSAQLVLAVK